MEVNINKKNNSDNTQQEREIINHQKLKSLNELETEAAESKSKSNLEHAINQVLNLESLSPCAKTNTTISHLTSTVINHSGSITFLPSAKVQAIRTAISTVEFELEKLYAEQIISSTDPLSALETFPWYGKYRKIIQRELNLISESLVELQTVKKSTPYRILFIGSGPLSLSSILYHEFIGAEVHNLDISSIAIELSVAVAKVLGISPAFEFLTGDAIQSSTFSSATTSTYDLIVIAALAGVCQAQKQRIVQNVLPSLCPKNGRILFRAGVGVREIFYPHIEYNVLEAVGLQVLGEYQPTEEFINTLIICKRK